MKKRAILYIRVSSDDQVKGYSLNSQEERLRKWCELKGVEASILFQEDHSAKSFDRPEWKKLLEYCKKNRGGIDYIIFVNWSRFSRNIAEAYAMINTLAKLGVEPQAIEQPLDTSIPENKMMLAFYLAAPEVENDRRSLNVTSGMRRARKEGRWAASARIGYKNIRDEQGKSMIVPSHYAPLIVEAFQEMSKGIITQKELYYNLKRKGLKCSANNFYNSLRDPIYCGKVFVPAYKDEESHFVKGVHEPIISEDLYVDVQDVLLGRRNKFPAKITRRDELPLRGYLVCKKCGGKITGSASHGNGGKYFYYHCQSKFNCNERFKAAEANKNFETMLSQISFDSIVLDVYFDMVMKDVFKSEEKDITRSIQKLNEEIKKNQDRISNAQQLMVDGEIPASEYREIKNRYEQIILNLNQEKTNLEMVDSDYLKYMEYGKYFFKNIDQFYQAADLEVKQKIIGSIFPEKLIYEEEAYRTTSVNQVLELIWLKNKGKRQNKNGLNNKLVIQSTKVEPTGSDSNQFGIELLKINELF